MQTIQIYAQSLIEECKDYGTFNGKFLIVDGEEVWIATEDHDLDKCQKIERVI